MTRSQLARQLEAARIAKQHAAPKSAAWYNADSRIEQISRALYRGRSIDINLDAEIES